MSNFILSVDYLVLRSLKAMPQYSGTTPYSKKNWGKLLLLHMGKMMCDNDFMIVLIIMMFVQYPDTIISLEVKMQYLVLNLSCAIIQ